LLKEFGVDATEFFTSWTFLLIMAGLLCFFVLLLLILIVLAIVFVTRANRENAANRE
jgi:hypothetical protein